MVLQFSSTNEEQIQVSVTRGFRDIAAGSQIRYEMSTDHDIPSWRKHVRIDISNHRIRQAETDPTQAIYTSGSASAETDSDEDRFAAWFDEMIVRSE